MCVFGFAFALDLNLNLNLLSIACCLATTTTSSAEQPTLFRHKSVLYPSWNVFVRQHAHIRTYICACVIYVCAHVHENVCFCCFCFCIVLLPVARHFVTSVRLRHFYQYLCICIFLISLMSTHLCLFAINFLLWKYALKNMFFFQFSK